MQFESSFKDLFFKHQYMISSNKFSVNISPLILLQTPLTFCLKSIAYVRAPVLKFLESDNEKTADLYADDFYQNSSNYVNVCVYRTSRAWNSFSAIFWKSKVLNNYGIMSKGFHRNDFL